MSGVVDDLGVHVEAPTGCGPEADVGVLARAIESGLRDLAALARKGSRRS